MEEEETEKFGLFTKYLAKSFSLMPKHSFSSLDYTSLSAEIILRPF